MHAISILRESYLKVSLHCDIERTICRTASLYVAKHHIEGNSKCPFYFIRCRKYSITLHAFINDKLNIVATYAKKDVVTNQLNVRQQTKLARQPFQFQNEISYWHAH